MGLLVAVAVIWAVVIVMVCLFFAFVLVCDLRRDARRLRERGEPVWTRPPAQVEHLDLWRARRQPAPDPDGWTPTPDSRRGIDHEAGW